MRLLGMLLAAVLLAGCAIVPLVPYGYAPPRPRPRATFIYPAHPIYTYPGHAPRHYHRGHW
ncbi:MAG TPA: hypothetical protein VLK35_21745 [Methylomirabilota bacterium]|nr:hypothetical protein [Methylomirabilota bacterium]